MNASQIYKSVLAAMDSAEEIGGPEGEEYVVLMADIYKEAERRAEACQKAIDEAGLIEVNGQRFEYLTLNVMRDQMTESGTSIAVYGWGTYEESSVLAGQAKKVFLDSFPTEAEARAAYPMVTGFSSKWTEPQVSLSHLPDDGDDDRYDVGDWSN